MIDLTMMPDINDGKTPRQRAPRPASGSDLPPEWAHRSPVESIDHLKRDRFELLSAYLDGEVSASDRRQIEDWLASDASAQQLYARLLKLRQGLHGLRTLPVPAERPVEQTVSQVMKRLERKPRRTVAWGGMAAAAALFAGAVTTVVAPSYLSPHVNVISSQSDSQLMIALDRPVIDIPDIADPSVAPPKTAVPVPDVVPVMPPSSGQPVMP
ncbi:anti-sigma factor family protein [Thermoleptolyngbya sp.]